MGWRWGWPTGLGDEADGWAGRLGQPIGLAHWASPLGMLTGLAHWADDWAGRLRRRLGWPSGLTSGLGDRAGRLG